jgi:hypothetical protein
MKIKFNIEDQLALSHWPPIPAKEFLPEWYKNMPDAKESYGFDDQVVKSIKACVPVSDFLTSGYILKATWEVRVSEQTKNFVSQMGIITASMNENVSNVGKRTDKDQGLHPNIHANIYDAKECPMRYAKNKNLKNYFRFNSEWTITTPPGYSCLIIQPYYLFNTHYSIMPTIIDTDKFNEKIPIVGYLTGETDEVRFFCGDPLVQVIPFKRDDWELELTTNLIPNKSKFFLYNAYRKLFHAEKKFK